MATRRKKVTSDQVEKFLAEATTYLEAERYDPDEATLMLLAAFIRKHPGQLEATILKALGDSKHA